MGRKVQLEEVVGGERRGALVDAVNVVIHPTTMVPELVVQLRYEGISPTPPPARATMKGRPQSTASKELDDCGGDEQLDDEEEHLFQPTAEALRERLGEAVSSASSVAQKAGGLLSQFAHSAKDRFDAMRPATVLTSPCCRLVVSPGTRSVCVICVWPRYQLCLALRYRRTPPLVGE
jgi:hypothetical protein